MHLGWELTNPMCAMSCITNFPTHSKPIIKKQDVLEEMKLDTGPGLPTDPATHISGEVEPKPASRALHLNHEALAG